LKQDFIEKAKKRDEERQLKQKERYENDLILKNEAKAKAIEKHEKIQEKIELAETMQEQKREQQINASKIAERIMEARNFERQQKINEKKLKSEKLFKIKSEKILNYKESELNERLRTKREKEIDSLERVLKLRKQQEDLQKKMIKNALIKDELIQKKTELGLEIEAEKVNKIKEKMRLAELTRIRLDIEKEKNLEEKRKINQEK